MKIIGDLKYFLGLELAYSKQGIILSQTKYVISFKDTRYLYYKPSNLPMDPQFKLNIKYGDPFLDPSL